jgi:hypothetical protein
MRLIHFNRHITHFHCGTSRQATIASRVAVPSAFVAERPDHSGRSIAKAPGVVVSHRQRSSSTAESHTL